MKLGVGAMPLVVSGQAVTLLSILRHVEAAGQRTLDVSDILANGSDAVSSGVAGLSCSLSHAQLVGDSGGVLSSSMFPFGVSLDSISASVDRAAASLSSIEAVFVRCDSTGLEEAYISRALVFIILRFGGGCGWENQP